MRKIFTPKEYQKLIIDAVCSIPRLNVWASMGTGKTSSTLTALGALRFIENPFPALVLAPKLVAESTWPDEVQKWAHMAGLRVVSIPARNAAKRAENLTKPADIYTINYENIPWMIKQLRGAWGIRTIIADESTRLKNCRSRQGGTRAQALKEVAFRSSRFVNLTGTPSPNGLQDLWGQQFFIDRGEALGRSYKAYTDRFFRPTNPRAGYMSSIEPLPYAKDEIMQRLAPSTISIQARDYFDLKEPIYTQIPVDLPPRARAEYKTLERDFLAEVEGMVDLEALDEMTDETHLVRASNAAVKNMKLLQMASGAVYVGKSGDWVETHREKLTALESIIEEAAGAPVLVAYHWRPDLARLLKHFPRGRVLDGKPETIRAWNSGKIPLMFVHPLSAGHGLNLQDGGNILAFFSHWWSLEARLQVIERIGPVRQMQAGHGRPVFIYDIVARGTVDKAVLLRHASKKSILDSILAYRSEL